jgi:hypothetical protein
MLKYTISIFLNDIKHSSISNSLGFRDDLFSIEGKQKFGMEFNHSVCDEHR